MPCLNIKEEPSFVGSHISSVWLQKHRNAVSQQEWPKGSPGFVLLVFLPTTDPFGVASGNIDPHVSSGKTFAVKI